MMCPVSCLPSVCLVCKAMGAERVAHAQAALLGKEALAARRTGAPEAGFTDDGFALGLAFLLKARSAFSQAVNSLGSCQGLSMIRVPASPVTTLRSAWSRRAACYTQLTSLLARFKHAALRCSSRRL